MPPLNTFWSFCFSFLWERIKKNRNKPIESFKFDRQHSISQLGNQWKMYLFINFIQNKAIFDRLIFFDVICCTHIQQNIQLFKLSSGKRNIFDRFVLLISVFVNLQWFYNVKTEFDVKILIVHRASILLYVPLKMGT